jgi:hypothetical protein
MPPQITHLSVNLAKDRMLPKMNPKQLKNKSIDVNWDQFVRDEYKLEKLRM